MEEEKRATDQATTCSSPISSSQDGNIIKQVDPPKHSLVSYDSYCSLNGTNSMLSQITAQNSDGDTTPIPSLHGNLVRNRYRRDPLEFYETLEPLGEGSMGSVSKVRKRQDVIGGSARPDFIKKHPPKLSIFEEWFKPIHRQSSEFSFTFSSGRQADGSQEMNCFSLFCCPVQERKASSSLDPIREDASLGGTLEDAHSQQQACWGKFLLRFLPKNGHNPKYNKIATKHGSEPSERDIKSQIEDELEKELKHSTSSMITYGHKDAVYALKSIHLDRVSNADFMKELKNEVEILKQLDHPHVVKCFETFHYNASLFLVLEICSGSDLYSRDPYSEKDAMAIIRGVLSAVSYMHSKNITHRDLKYENIMFASMDKDAEVKIIDFGLSKKYASDTFLHDTVGTVYTMAPELLKGGYTNLVDCWSLGVIAFMLLSSSMPFYGKDRKQVIKKIVKGNYQFISRRWKTVSSDAKKFVVRMLMHDPQRRPSAAEALEDPWFSQSFDFQGFSPEVALLDKVQAAIQSFAGYGRLKRLALMLIAYRATNEEIGYLRKMFERFDRNNDGEITCEEFKKVLVDYEYTDLELESMFRAMNLDGTGLVHYSEFLAATIEAHGSLSEEQVAECFDQLDNDDSGFISKEDIMDILGGGIPQSYVDSIMDEADLNHDNKISYSEFLALWDHRADEKIKKDKEDVKERRHRRADSMLSEVSCASEISDFEDEFDEYAVHKAFSFEENEIGKLFEAPDTPVSGKRLSAVNAFVLEKERSTRDASTRRASLSAMSPSATPRPIHAILDVDQLAALALPTV